MSDPKPKPEPPTTSAAGTPPAGNAAGAEQGKPVDVSQLTPEEQMALFEKDLKENDWGHQPC